MKKKCGAYNTWCSQAVTHLSTNHARRCLTSVIGREPVFSTWYGRRHPLSKRIVYIYLVQSHMIVYPVEWLIDLFIASIDFYWLIWVILLMITLTNAGSAHTSIGLILTASRCLSRCFFRFFFSTKWHSVSRCWLVSSSSNPLTGLVWPRD